MQDSADCCRPLGRLDSVAQKPSLLDRSVASNCAGLLRLLRLPRPAPAPEDSLSDTNGLFLQPGPCWEIVFICLLTDSRRRVLGGSAHGGEELHGGAWAVEAATVLQAWGVSRGQRLRVRSPSKAQDSQPSGFVDAGKLGQSPDDCLRHRRRDSSCTTMLPRVSWRPVTGRLSVCVCPGQSTWASEPRRQSDVRIISNTRSCCNWGGHGVFTASARHRKERVSPRGGRK